MWWFGYNSSSLYFSAVERAEHVPASRNSKPHGAEDFCPCEDIDVGMRCYGAPCLVFFFL
ncbi:hypothetical protein C7212DRAFT_321544, partial [Tuber magnatum]